jgi:hypothetical protein
MRARGVAVNPPVEGARRTPAGLELRWKVATLQAGHPLPIFFIEHLTPIEARRAQLPGTGPHPNGVQRIERIHVVTPDFEAACAAYAHVLGMPRPQQLERDDVLVADVAVFGLGTGAVCIARPVGEGPAAEALARRGAGVFHALCRTAAPETASQWMAAQGLQPLARRTCSTGEQALLAPPQDAGGTYLAFAGMA